MNITLILSAIAFIVSFGSWSNFERQRKNEPILFESSAIGALIITVTPILCFIMLNLTLNKLIDVSWFWNLLISIVLMVLLSNLLAEIYALFLGIKSTKKIDLMTGEMNKKVNIYIMNAFITFGVGVILYFIGK